MIRGHCSIGKTIIDPLTEEDSILNNHTVLGANILDGNSSPLLSLASVIAQSHHERYDGSGYPLGLKGKEIPIEGRIVAVADVYDALSSHRPYKPAFEEDRCFELILRDRGEHLDPECVDAFFSRVTDIVKITEELGV